MLKQSIYLSCKTMKNLMWIPFIALLFSCEKVQDSELLIDSVVEIELLEAVAAGTGEITLRCKTLKEYICYNYVIGYDKAGEGNALKINFQHIALGATQQCATAIGPATAEIALGKLEDGLYFLELNNGKLVNKGILEVSATEFILNFPQQTGIDILTPVVLR
ncbi:hypothetical protein D770_25810 [Flammeovirgaceae bacterium 311]|nr:hypothetical protein D770_25810 [Flammeovirgaceae bacterium 311]